MLNKGNLERTLFSCRGQTEAVYTISKPQEQPISFLSQHYFTP